MGQDDKLLLGEAAEHLVISRVLREGMLAGQAPRGWKHDDIVVTPIDRSRILTIQVKATDKTSRTGWMVGGVVAAPNRFCALVDYQDRANPAVFLLPSAEVVRASNLADARYHELRSGAAFTKMRKIQDPFPRGFDLDGLEPDWLTRHWRERWDLLGET